MSNEPQMKKITTHIPSTLWQEVETWLNEIPRPRPSMRQVTTAAFRLFSGASDRTKQNAIAGKTPPTPVDSDHEPDPFLLATLPPDEWIARFFAALPVRADLNSLRDILTSCLTAVHEQQTRRQALGWTYDRSTLLRVMQCITDTPAMAEETQIAARHNPLEIIRGVLHKMSPRAVRLLSPEEQKEVDELRRILGPDAGVKRKHA